MHTPRRLKCQSKVIRDSNRDFRITPDPDVCWIAAKMLWIHCLVGVGHCAKFCKNQPVTVWGMVRSLLQCHVPRWWKNEKGDPESTCGSGSAPEVNQLQRVTTCPCLPLFGRRPFPLRQLSCSQNDRQTERRTDGQTDGWKDRQNEWSLLCRPWQSNQLW